MGLSLTLNHFCGCFNILLHHGHISGCFPHLRWPPGLWQVQNMCWVFSWVYQNLTCFHCYCIWGEHPKTSCREQILQHRGCMKHSESLKLIGSSRFQLVCHNVRPSKSSTKLWNQVYQLWTRAGKRSRTSNVFPMILFELVFCQVDLLWAFLVCPWMFWAIEIGRCGFGMGIVVHKWLMKAWRSVF